MIRCLSFLVLFFVTGDLLAAEPVSLLSTNSTTSISEPLQIVIGLSLLSLVPLLLVATTCFTRFIIVFSMLRFALGLQQTPPNVVLISLSLFLSIFVMAPTINQIESQAVSPFIAGDISEAEMLANAKNAANQFMISQTRKEDLALITRLANEPMPQSASEVKFTQLVPAFLLSELRTAFKIAFVIFLPFLLIDLVVSSVLMSLGMIMVPPTTISLPIKVLLFVVLDGWNLITESLVTSVVS